MAFKRILEDTLPFQHASISGDVRQEVVAWKGFSNIQEFYMLRPVLHCIIPFVSGHPALQSSVFWGRQAKLWIGRFFFELSGVHYQHVPTHLRALHVVPVYNSSWH